MGDCAVECVCGFGRVGREAARLLNKTVLQRYIYIYIEAGPCRQETLVSHNHRVSVSEWYDREAEKHGRKDCRMVEGKKQHVGCEIV